MHIAFLKDVFAQNAGAVATIWRDSKVTFGELLSSVAECEARLSSDGVTAGRVVALQGDFSPRTIALLLALIDRGCIVVPQMRSTHSSRVKEMLEIAEVEHAYRVDEEDGVSSEPLGLAATHPLFQRLRVELRPGLVLFTSGSSGTPKAAVHDFTKLLEKFKARRPSLKILNFLLFDHWGGLNTMFHTLSNAGTVITVPDRSPDTVCRAVAQHRIEVLPASPTFLNLLLLSEAYKRHDLSSLKVISYGTEPMPQSTLKKVAELFPGVKLQQTYGLIELGVLRSKSMSSDSLWVKIGGEGFDYRVADGLLEIKAESAMLGYLNAESPFTPDGWFKTGDAVEVNGEYLRILGRRSEQINVGGEKVFPAEVESVLQEDDNVAEAMVFGEKNPLVGNMVCAKVRLHHPEDPKAVTLRLKMHCKARLESFKVPVRVQVVDQIDHSERGKKLRR